MSEFTTNLKLELPDFNVATWHDPVNKNFEIIDQFLYALTGVYVQGYWQNSTAYAVGEKILDSVDGKIYRCLVNHTSAASGTFAADRVANPTYWELVTSSDNDVGDILSAVTPAANKLIKFTSISAATTIDITTWGQAWIAFANVAAAKTELGISSFAETLLDDADAATMRATLVLGDAALETIGVSGNRVPKLNGNNTHSGTLTVTAAFTSVGINDDATAERLKIENSGISVGPAAGNGHYTIYHPYNQASLSIGFSTGYFRAFGSAHATLQNDLHLTSNSVVVYEYDYSVDAHRFHGQATTGNLVVIPNAVIVSRGTEAAPGVSFSGDQDTGMYRIDTNQIGFSTNGTLALSIGSSGNVTATGNLTAFSDEKLKKDINTIQNALSKVNQLRGVEFLFKRNNEKSMGLIAQEAQQVVPEVIHSFTNRETNEETLSIAYPNLVGLLIEAIKELSTRVVELEEKVNGTA